MSAFAPLTSFFLALAAFVLSAACFAAERDIGALDVIGTPQADELSGTRGRDYYYGGDGADVFVINYLSDLPDEILDFEPAEGDTIALAFPEVAGRELDSEDFWVTAKGVVKWRLPSGRDRGVVDTNRGGLTLSLEKRKGRYLLTFEKAF